MFGTNAFGNNTSGFGTFTNPNPPNASTNFFGQTAASQPQTTSLFGGGTTPAFGVTQQQTAPVFGGFGQTPAPSLFGQQQTTQPIATTTGGLFGGTTSPFSATPATQQLAGTSIRFVAPTGTEVVTKNAVHTTVATNHQVITAMKEYEAKSLEELRLEDYQLNRKGPQQQTSLFGGATAAQPQTAQSLFTGGGTTNLFGQNTATSTTTNLFGSQANKPGGIFGSTTTTTTPTAFGAGTTNTGFQFGSTATSQPQQQSIFGTTSTTTPATSTGFSFQPQQQQQSQPFSMWNQKAAVPAVTVNNVAPTFGTGIFWNTSTATTNKPLFGSFGTGTTTAAPAFGSGPSTSTLFQNSNNATNQQQMNKPFGSSLFPSTSTPAASTTQPIFGTGFAANPLISTTTAGQPATMFGTPNQPMFGGGVVATTTPNTGFSFGSFGAPAQATTTPSLNFGTGFGTTNNVTTGGNVSLFNPAPTSTPFAGFGGGFQSQQQQPAVSQQQQPYQYFQQLQPQVPGFITFATTPYKDNPLFHNLIANRKLEDMTRPTSPYAMRQFLESHRKTRNSPVGATNLSTNSPINNNLSWKRMSNDNIAATRTNGNASISKLTIWNGFEDDVDEKENVYGANLLEPARMPNNWKRLVLNSAPTTPLMGNENEKKSPPQRNSSSPFSKSLTFSNSPSQRRFASSYNSRWQKSGLTKQRTRLNLNTLGSEIDEEVFGGGGGDANAQVVGRDSFVNSNSNSLQDDLNKSLSGIEAHRKSSTRTFRIKQVLGESSQINSSSPFGSSLLVEEKDEKENTLPSSPSPELLEKERKSPSTPSSPRQLCGLICTRPGYYVNPPVEELDKMLDRNGACYVPGFEVGRRNFGKIKFIPAVNVVGINIDEIVNFRHKEVVVYPDDEQKPPIFSGLNAPAIIELERCWPIDKKTNEPIRCLKKIEELKYEEKLRNACKRLGAEFISYDEEDCVWKFQVAHFSKYSCEVEEDDDDEDDEKLTKQPTTTLTAQQKERFNLPLTGLGLGGIPLSHQQKQMAAIAKHIVGPGGDAGAATFSSMPEVPQPSLKDTATLNDVGIAEKSSLLQSININTNTSSIDDFWGEKESLWTQHYLPTPPKKPKAQTNLLGLSSFSALSHSNHQLASSSAAGIWSGLEMELEESSSQLKRLELAGLGRQSLVRDIYQQQQQVDKEKAEFLSHIPPQQQTIMHIVRPVEFLSVSEPNLQENLFGRLNKIGNTTNLKIQGCPRVCFLPSGQFISINQEVKASGFSAQVKVRQLSSYADKQESAILSGPSRTLLQNQLEERLRIRQGVMFKEHIQAIQAQIGDGPLPMMKAELEQELAFWQLCNILWPEKEICEEEIVPSPDDGALLTQRINMCNWLRDFAPILFGSVYRPEDSSVLGQLKKGLVEEACKVALDKENLILATLLASDPHLHLQFEDCPELMQDGMLEPTTSDIFSLISGSMTGLSELTAAKVKYMSTDEWFQYFALFMWYNGPAKTSLSIPLDKAIREYEEMMRSIIVNESDEEDIHYFPCIEIRTMANLCMHLLKMYSCTGYPMHLIFSPRTWSKDYFDYKVVWLLMRDLEEIGYLAEEQTVTELCLSFAGELESIGLWTWAVFVLRNIIPGSELEDDEEECAKLFKRRDAFCMRLLERNINANEEDLDSECFLVYRLGIEEKLLYSIKCWKSEKPHEKIWYLGKMGEWQKSLQMLIKYLTEENNGLTLVSEKAPASGYSKNVIRHFERIRQNHDQADDWDNQGGMLYNYLKLKIVYSQEPGAANEKKGMEEELTQLASNFLQAVIKFQPKDSRQSALLLEMALHAQKVIQCLFVTSVFENPAKLKLYENLQQFFSIPVPNEYFEGLKSFILSCFNDFMGEPAAVATTTST